MTASAGPAATATLGVEGLLRAYEEMRVIRGVEKAAHDLFLRGLVKGTTHLAAGQEAVAVGASEAAGSTGLSKTGTARVASKEAGDVLVDPSPRPASARS